MLPEQINKFTQKFKKGQVEFFIHVDSKSDITSQIEQRKNVHLLPDEYRVNVKWGSWSQVQATLKLIEYAHKYGAYDYYWLCSGQDFPIKSYKEIIEKFQKSECNYIDFATSKNYKVEGKYNKFFDKRYEIAYPNWIIGREKWKKIIKYIYVMLTGGKGHTFSFLKKVPPGHLKIYFGSQWWCLNKKTIVWIIQYVHTHQSVIEFFKQTLCPDESFFQSLVMESPFHNNILSNLVYIDWSEGKSSPKILKIED